MGLINELHSISDNMKWKERQKLEKQNAKIELDQYNQEIQGNLETQFYYIFNKLSVNEAYKTAVINKDLIINRITEYIESIKVTENRQVYYKYKNKYDIVTDLQANFFKILNKIKKEYIITESAENDVILYKLESYINTLYEKATYKEYAQKQLNQKKWIDAIIEDVAESETQKDYLYNNYFKVLQKVTKFYNGYIQEEKETEREIIKQEKQKQVKKRLDRIGMLYIINKML